MSGFPPKPGTAAYRVLAYLETILPRRPRATAGMVAGELRGLTPVQVRDALEAAHAAGYVNREAEVSVGARGPVFYELVRNTAGDFAVGGAGLRTYSVPPPALREEQMMLTGTAATAPSGGVIEPVVEPIPEPPATDTAAPIESEPTARSAKVVSIERRMGNGEVELEPTPQLSDWLRATRGVPVAERDDPEVHVPPPFPAQVFVAAAGPAASLPPEPVIPSSVQLDFAPGPDQFAVALASDGRLFCWRGSVPFVFTRAESRVLVQHLNLMDLDVLLDLEGGA
jgi:hypothetical protein